MTCDIWHVTCDMWHVTRDMWHMTCDMLWGVNILSTFPLPSFYGLWFMIFWRLGGKGSRTDLINQLINDKGVCRTAPATPGLLNIGLCRTNLEKVPPHAISSFLGAWKLKAISGLDTFWCPILILKAHLFKQKNTYLNFLLNCSLIPKVSISCYL